jgi:hypothetical protein
MYGSPAPGPPISPWLLIVNHLTLSYKRLGWTPLPRCQKNERLMLDMLEHNTTQFFCGRRVLRSGGPNHINHCVHHVHLELTAASQTSTPSPVCQIHRQITTTHPTSAIATAQSVGVEGAGCREREQDLSLHRACCLPAEGDQHAQL